MVEMRRAGIFGLVFAVVATASAANTNPALDCEAMLPKPPDVDELIVSPVTLAARDKLLDVLKRAGLRCVTQFRSTGDCLVRYERKDLPEPRIVAAQLRLNIHALLSTKAVDSNDQRVIGDVFVNGTLEIKQPAKEAVAEALPGSGNSKSIADPYFYKQRPLRLMNIEKAWEGQGDARSIVAVLDEGVWLEHPDLKSNLKPGITFPCDRTTSRCDGSPMSPYLGHGTTVAGVIGAVRGNELGIAGAASNPWILPVNVGTTTVSDASASCGVEYAYGQHASVINISWAGSDKLPLLYKTMLAAPEDVVFVAAAGDGGTRISVKHPVYPVSYGPPNMIGATDHGEDNEALSSSNYGEEFVQIAAQSYAYTTLQLNPENQDLYGLKSGSTSYSTAYVSSMVALLKTRYPCWSHEWLKWRIIKGAIFEQQLEHVSESRGRLDFGAIMFPVVTAPTRLVRTGATLVDWKKGIRGDMCPMVTLRARVGETGNMGQYGAPISITFNDGEELVDATALPQNAGKFIQFQVSCLNNKADAESLPLELTN